VPVLVTKLPPVPLFLIGSLIMAVARLGIAASVTVLHVSLADLLVGIGSAICATVGSSLLAQVCDPTQIGLAMGLSESAQGLAGVVTPALAGMLYEAYGSSSPGVSASVCCIVAALVLVVAMPWKFGAQLEKKAV